MSEKFTKNESSPGPNNLNKISYWREEGGLKGRKEGNFFRILSNIKLSDIQHNKNTWTAEIAIVHELDLFFRLTLPASSFNVCPQNEVCECGYSNIDDKVYLEV